MNSGNRGRLATGFLFIAPWLVGFLALSLYPFLSSLYLSGCDYSVLAPAVWIGPENYTNLAQDPIFWKAAGNTVLFAMVSVPLGLLLSFLLALLLNADIPARGFFRTVFFLPSLMPLVCLAVLWLWLLNGDLGLVNACLRPFLGLGNHLFGASWAPPNWLQDPHFALAGLVLTGIWGVGHPMVIFLAGLQEVPRHLYESADIDGASPWQKLRHITLPMLSPVIYFNGLMALIGCFQVFAVPFVMTEGGDGPERSLLFLATYLYQHAFEYWNMGYACAIGLFLFCLILGLTWVASRVSSRHVHYEGA
ncbi:MAG: sugar ABC transporter permease [Verrucomicrobia bacterium]|nr:sugar ABC transporter permease [Verrucomicrobiota bacterium]